MISNPIADEHHPPLLLNIMSTLTRSMPPVRGCGFVRERIAKPLCAGISKGTEFAFPFVLGTTLVVDPQDYIGGIIAFTPKCYDPTEFKSLESILSRGACFVDVGSNLGAYTVIAAKRVGPEGRVIAIEPDPINHLRLLKNIARNGLSGIVHPVEMAVLDKSGMAALSDPQNGNRGGINFRGNGTRGSLVRCASLSQILRSSCCEAVDFMKIDIEGSEEKVLRQFFDDERPVSALRPKYLLIEENDGPNTAAEKSAIAQLLFANGYRPQWARGNTLYKRQEGMG